ncbi:hypothetical protein EASAB2608_01506 [Streptomyces sp. EAS-AB2608]|nr:hypothetical protein EASAB2608_01506 [Streptomyces sp. EAS-AB2608]
MAGRPQCRAGRSGGRSTRHSLPPTASGVRPANGVRPGSGVRPGRPAGSVLKDGTADVATAAAHGRQT